MDPQQQDDGARRRGRGDGDDSNILERPVINAKYCDKFLVAHVLARGELLSHPIDYMTSLVQLGYEPVPPTISKSLFGRTTLYNAGFFSYMNYIIRSDGILGIYRGLKYNIATTIAYNFTYHNTNYWLGETRFFKSTKSKDKGSETTDFKELAEFLGRESVARFISLGVSYPFRVLMIRSMAQFVGGETIYDSTWGGIADILENGSFSALWSGFIPYFLGHVAFLTLEKLILYLLHNSFDKKYALGSNQLVGQITGIVARSMTYPFRITSTVMACNGSSARSLAASAFTGAEYSDWVACARTLYSRNEIKRGSSLFWRVQPLNTFGFQPMVPFKKAKRT